LLRAAAALLIVAVLARSVAARDLPSTLKSPFSQQGNCVGVYSTDFSNAVLRNVTEWNGNPACADFVTEFPAAPASISSEGGKNVLQMNLVKSPYLNEFDRPFGRESAVSWSRWWQYGSMCMTFKYFSSFSGTLSPSDASISQNCSRRRHRLSCYY
jgi:hypothetical protein